MGANLTIFLQLWNLYALPIDAGGPALIGGLMALIGPWFKLCVSAYLVVMMLINAWGGGDDRTILLMFRAAFFASVVYAISFQAQTFDYFVTQFVHGTTNKITTAIAAGFGGGQIPAADTYDALATRCYVAGLAVYKTLPTWSFKGALLSICIFGYWALAIAAIFVMFLINLLAYTIGDLLIDIGPLLIPLLFFPFTRVFFDGWLGCITTTMLVQILNAALVTLGINTINGIISASAAALLAPGNDDVGIGSVLLLDVLAMVCVAFGVASASLVYIAARIAGGTALRLPYPEISGGGRSSPSHTQSTTNQIGGGNAPTPSPAPQPAFTRTVGAAS